MRSEIEPDNIRSIIFGAHFTQSSVGLKMLGVLQKEFTLLKYKTTFPGHKEKM